MATLMVVSVKPVNQGSTCHSGKQCRYGANDGKGKSHQRKCSHNGVHTRLRSGNQERGNRSFGSTILAHGHCRWDNTARAQGQGYAYECSIDDAAERFLGKVLVEVLPWYKGVHDTCYEETQEQVGRHACYELDNFIHIL